MIYYIAVILTFIAIVLVAIFDKLENAEHADRQKIKELQDLNERLSNYVDEAERYLGA